MLFRSLERLERAAKGGAELKQLATGGEGAWVYDMLADVAQKKRGTITSAMPLAELGFDSLMFTELAAALEAAGVELPDPAELVGLSARKGAIAPGRDADLVVFDPDYRGTISASTQAMNVDYSAFEGWKIEGRPDVVTVRGQIAVRGGKFVGRPGHGKFLPRKPSHF